MNTNKPREWWLGLTGPGELDRFWKEKPDEFDLAEGRPSEVVHVREVELEEDATVELERWRSYFGCDDPLDTDLEHQLARTRDESVKSHHAREAAEKDLKRVRERQHEALVTLKDADMKAAGLASELALCKEAGAAQEREMRDMDFAIADMKKLIADFFAWQAELDSEVMPKELGDRIVSIIGKKERDKILGIKK